MSCSARTGTAPPSRALLTLMPRWMPSWRDPRKLRIRADEAVRRWPAGRASTLPFPSPPRRTSSIPASASSRPTRHGRRMANGSRGSAESIGAGTLERFRYRRDDRRGGDPAEQRAPLAFRTEIAALLGDGAVLVLPTVPGAAPLKSATPEALQAYRERALHLLCLAGLSGFPQIRLPLGSVHGAPFGISLLGPPDSDIGADQTRPPHSRERRKGLTGMDTLTRMRAFIDVVEAEGFSAAGAQDRPLEGAAVEICARAGGRARRAAPQPHDPAVLADRGRPHLLQARLRDRARGRQPRRRRARILRRRARPHKAVGAAHFRRRADRPVADRFRRGSIRRSCWRSSSTTASSTWSRKASTLPSASRGWRARR